MGDLCVTVFLGCGDSHKMYVVLFVHTVTDINLQKRYFSIFKTIYKTFVDLQKRYFASGHRRRKTGFPAGCTKLKTQCL